MSKYADLTDAELMRALWEAQEMRIGYKIRQIKQEINKRNSEL